MKRRPKARRYHGNRVRRERIYAHLCGLYGGYVPCFVCRLPVAESEATLEHVIPLSKGGTNRRDNLSISHRRCNNGRGAP